MVQDLEPLTTPNTVLTDCLNGTIITYNGNEFVLQNDMGNCKVERAKLSPGFLPMGMKEYGGIIYIASYNPDTKECELGSFPSPERDITGTDSIENQTGLQDGFFATDDYQTSIIRLMPSGVFNPTEIVSKIQKLNEQEVLQLNPGDMYITTYEIEEPSSPTPGAVVIDSSNFEDYFSWDENDKKVFSINFYKIDSGNNIVSIPGNEIGTIEYRPDIEADEYIYYTQTSAGSIAVEIALNTLSYFSSSIRETSRRSDPVKTIRLEAIGETESDVEFEGIRVDVVRNEGELDEERESFHIEKISSANDKVSASVTGLAAEDIVKCDITPYNQYGYMPKLMQSHSLEIGRNPFGGGVNDVFKWRVDDINNRLELDFDFKFDTDNTLGLYLEFYDTWSNVSMMRNIPAPSIYGPMRLTINLVTDEARNTTFDTYPTPPSTPIPTNQKGGIPFSRLAVSNNNIMIPYLIEPTQSDNLLLIRNDNALRKNHFYVVRICGYEEDNTTGTIIRTFHDVYRGLYTNSIYNNIYEEQANMSQDNPNYEPNFNKIPYPLYKIGYTASLANAGNPLVRIGATTTTYSTTELTTINGVKYPFSLNGRPDESEVWANERFKYNKNYSINITRPDNYIYGSLEPNTLQITTPAGNVNITSKIEDPSSISVNLDPNSTGNLTIPNFNSGASAYSVGLEVETNRGIQGTVVPDTIEGSPTTLNLKNLMYKPDYTGTSQTCSTGCNSTYYGGSTNVTWLGRRTTGSDRECCFIRRGDNLNMAVRDGSQMGSGWSTYKTVNSKTKNEDSIDSISALNTGGLEDYQFFSFAFTTEAAYAAHQRPNNTETHTLLLFVQRYGGTPKTLLFRAPTGTNKTNFNTHVASFLEKLEVTYVDSNQPDQETYYVSPSGLLSYGSGNVTSINGLTLEIKSEWDDPVIKTYVFNALIKALNNTAIDFNTTNINELITDAISRSSNEVVEDPTPTLSDNGFIPFIDSSTDIPEIVTNLLLGDESIILGTSAALINIFETAQTRYTAEYESIDNSDNTSEVRIVEGHDSEDLRQFARCFRYSIDSGVGELVLSNVPPLTIIYAINGKNNGIDTWGRNIDMVTRAYNFT